LPSHEFLFLGFLDAKRSARRTKLETLRGETRTMVFYEAPHRILETIDDLREILGDREVSVSREMTKVHEEHLQGMLSGVRDRINPLGEFTLVVAGAAGGESVPPRELTRDGVLKILGISRNQLYDLFFKK
jgi:16S rRNA (cytidine1402-2'-O)-methyltransferase